MKIEKHRCYNQRKAIWETSYLGLLLEENIGLAEAQNLQRHRLEYNPDSYGTEEYMNLCKEIIERR